MFNYFTVKCMYFFKGQLPTRVMTHHSRKNIMVTQRSCLKLEDRSFLFYIFFLFFQVPLLHFPSSYFCELCARDTWDQWQTLGLTSSQNTSASQVDYDKLLQGQSGCVRREMLWSAGPQGRNLSFVSRRDFLLADFHPVAFVCKVRETPPMCLFFFLFSIVTSNRAAEEILRASSASSPASCYLLLLLCQPRLNLGCSCLSISTLTSFSSSHRRRHRRSWRATICKSTSLKERE